MSTFKVEADEHIKNITAGLIELEKDLDPQVKAGIIETVFREAHSLKGAARAVNLTDIETICQSLESVFSGLKTREIDLAVSLFDTLHRAVDLLKEQTRTSPEEPVVHHDKVSGIKEKLAKALRGESGAGPTIQDAEPIHQESPQISEPAASPSGPEPLQGKPLRRFGCRSSRLPIRFASPSKKWTLF